MKRYYLTIFIILICMLALAACIQYEDKGEYTYPEFPLEEESPAIESNTHAVENSKTETNIVEDSESNSSDAVTEAHTIIVIEDTTYFESISTEGSLSIETEETELATEILETETTKHHTDALDENGYCDICGEKILDDIPNENESTANTEEASEEEASEEVTELTTTAQYALFDKFYDSNFDINETKHSNGGKMTEKSDTYIANGYMLKFLNYANVYKNARDAKGNPALKVGKTDAVGAFEIQIPANISTVVFKVAKYKDHASSIIINGVQYVLTKNSDDGEYDVITVDTKENKIIKFTTADAYKVCMIRSIEFIK